MFLVSNLFNFAFHASLFQYNSASFPYGWLELIMNMYQFSNPYTGK